MKNCLLALSAITSALIVLASDGRAELVFTPASNSFAGDVRVTQTPLGEWVNILIEYETSANITSLSGGFRALDAATFSQGQGSLDTTFLLPPQALIFGGVDTAQELSLQGATVLGGTLGTTGQINTLAQLVLAPGTSAETFATGVQLANAGGLVGTIGGSVTAVPEPSVAAGLGLAVLGWIGVRYRRRHRLAIA